jgi:hypothetical protein
VYLDYVYVCVRSDPAQWAGAGPVIFGLAEDIARRQSPHDGPVPNGSQSSPPVETRLGHVTWTAQLGPVLNADSSDALREAIKRAYAEVLAKISERTPGASPASPGVVPNVSGLLLPGTALRPVDARLDAVENQVQAGQELLTLGQRVGRR